MEGFFIVPRGLMDRAVFRREPFTEFQAFVWLLERAAFRPRQVEVNGHVIELDRGQLAASVRFLAAAWGWQKSRVDRYTKKLKSRTLIETDTGTGSQIITVCNYDEIQRGLTIGGTAGGTPTGTEAGQQAGQIRNKGNKQGKQRTEDFDEWFGMWWDRFPKYRRGSKGPTRTKIETILRRKKATREDLDEGLNRYLAAGYGDSESACGTLVWLNQERWTIESFPAPIDKKNQQFSKARPSLTPEQQARANALAEDLRLRREEENRPMTPEQQARLDDRVEELRRQREGEGRVR